MQTNPAVEQNKNINIRALNCSISEIDECSTGEDNCQQLCNNLPGTYNCSCNTGFMLNNDSRTCSGRTNGLVIHFDFGLLLIIQKLVPRTQRITHSEIKY